MPAPMVAKDSPAESSNAHGAKARRHFLDTEFVFGFRLGEKIV